MAYNITFSPDAWADYLYWQSEDKKTLKRINKLLQELQRDGAVQGIGKAELLRKIKGMSKRIDDTCVGAGSTATTSVKQRRTQFTPKPADILASCQSPKQRSCS